MQAEEMRTVQLSIDSEIGTRKGCFSDLAIITDKDGVARIDFLLGDIPGESGDDIRCALVSRVFMSVRDLVNLKTAIDDQLKKIDGTGNVRDEA